MSHTDECVICGYVCICTNLACSEGSICAACEEEAEMLATADLIEPYRSDIFAEIAADREN
jgi:hypothetical protein